MNGQLVSWLLVGAMFSMFGCGLFPKNASHTAGDERGEATMNAVKYPIGPGGKPEFGPPTNTDFSLRVDFNGVRGETRSQGARVEHEKPAWDSVKEFISGLFMANEGGAATKEAKEGRPGPGRALPGVDAPAEIVREVENFRTIEELRANAAAERDTSRDKIVEVINRSRLSLAKLDKGIKDGAKRHNQAVDAVAVKIPGLEGSTITFAGTLKSSPTSEGGKKVREVMVYRNYVIATAGQSAASGATKAFLETADAAIVIADEAYAVGDNEGGDIAVGIAGQVPDVALGVTPGVGWAKDFFEAVTGQSLVTGAELDALDRTFAVIGVLTVGVGSKLILFRKGGAILEKIAAKAGREGAALERAVKEAAKVADSAKNARPVKIPYGTGEALQEMTGDALKVRAKVNSGVPLYRIGTRGTSQTGGQAQFWSHENPLSPGYAERYGIPPENYRNMDFLEVAALKDNVNFITRKAPGYGPNAGGAIEVVVPEGGVLIVDHISL